MSPSPRSCSPPPTSPRRNAPAYVSDTLGRLLSEPRILPIINENDSVAVEELKFGDNDMLSVLVAKLAGAKRVIFLTSVDGLLDPETNTLIPEVTDIDEVLRHVRDDKGRFSMGGMTSKLTAVKFAVDAGIETHIAHGRHPRTPRRTSSPATAFPPAFMRPNVLELITPMSTLQETIHQMGRQARAAAYQARPAHQRRKKRDPARDGRRYPPARAGLLEANDLDLAAGATKGLSAAMLDRLRLDAAAHRGDGRGHRPGRHAARSGRPDHGVMGAP